MAIIIGILSLFATLLGISVALIQYYSRIKTERILKTQLFVLINRIYAMVPNRGYIEELLQDVENKKLNRWVQNTSKGLSSLYTIVVGHYLSSEKKFTYEDLEKMKKDGVIIYGSWEERIWRELIARRPENVKRIPNK